MFNGEIYGEDVEVHGQVEYGCLNFNGQASRIGPVAPGCKRGQGDFY